MAIIPQTVTKGDIWTITTDVVVGVKNEAPAQDRACIYTYHKVIATSTREKRSFKERLDELPKEKTKAGHGHHDDSEHDSCFSLSSGRHTPDLEEDNSDAENPQQQHVKSRAESCAEKVVYTRRERTASPICIVMSAGSTYSTGHLRCVIKLELTATGDITITKRFGPTTQYFSLADHVHGTLCCGR
ncbi:uncharacterized protein K444DRAFT_631524 [Hyaloscypha bicolor E]|uniref:Uncharacterized protein n=1 Tax=Hyaloscypha bicolor E TaxID=1095630 RepID=A0A2J6T443_9HELO|nr:uncharacterized protein K444DRAFT_631524 [Hyaloscypha bicolor E]PMD57782.1 hypothetical protein K444DRAFT_631524 [Hyaloscypha bicolor E]